MEYIWTNCCYPILSPKLPLKNKNKFPHLASMWPTKAIGFFFCVMSSFFLSIYLFYVCGCYVWMKVCAHCVPGPRRPEGGIGFPGTGLTDGCHVSAGICLSGLQMHEWWALNPGPYACAVETLPSEPSPQPNRYIFEF